MREKSAKNPKKENSGPAGSGEPGTGPEFPEAREQQVALRTNPRPRPAERATALRGQGIGRPPQPKSVRRRQTQGDIFGKDPEIPYMKFEVAARDLLCSLMERQDRMNEEIFYRMNDLGSRLDDLEDGLQENGGGG